MAHLSLQVRSALKLMSVPAIDELEAYLTEHTYIYMVAMLDEPIEPEDFRNLKKIKGPLSVNQVLERLYEDPVILRCVISAYTTYRKLDASATHKTIQEKANSLTRTDRISDDIKAAVAMTYNDLTTIIPKEEMICYIAHFTRTDILLFDLNFERIILYQENNKYMIAIAPGRDGLAFYKRADE